MQDREMMIEMLNANHRWPTRYSFKFIVPIAQEQTVKGLLQAEKYERRPSKKGNYVSVSCELPVQSADDVLEVYDRVRGIEGIISI